MKKIVGIVLLLLVVVLLGGPFYAGMKAESELENAVRVINGYPGYNVTWSEYQRGWLSTKAELAIGLDTGEWPAENGEPVLLPILPLNISIHHGPLLLDSGLNPGWYSWRLELTPDQTEWLEQHLTSAGEGQLYDAWGHMGLLGQVEFGDKLQAFTVDDEEGNRFITANGYSGSGTVGADRQLRYTGQFDGMDIASQDALLVLGEITMAATGDLSRIDWKTFLYPSEFTMTLANMRVEGNDGAMSMTKASFAGAVNMPADENWFDLVMSMDIENISAQNVRVDNASMSLAYERISLSAYQAYIDMVTAMAESPDADVDYQQFFTAEVMQEFFDNRPALALRNLSFEMPDGSLDSDFELAMREGFVMPPQLSNPLMLLEAVTLTANAKIDRSLAIYMARESARARTVASMSEDPEAAEEDIEAALDEQAQAMVDMLTSQNIVVEDGEDLKTAMQFMNGQLLLNGNPMPLPLGLLMGGH